MGPVSPSDAVDGVEIHKIAKGQTHNGREARCQQAELPISQAISHSTFSYLQTYAK